MAVTQLLLASGASVATKDKDGFTALHEAALSGDEAMTQLLIDHDADLEVKDEGGNTALYLATIHGCEEVVQTLISNGASVHEMRADHMEAREIVNLKWARTLTQMLDAWAYRMLMSRMGVDQSAVPRM